MKKTILATMIGMAVLTGCERSDNQNEVAIPVPPPAAEEFNSPLSIFFEGMGEGSLTDTEVRFNLSGSAIELDALDVSGAEIDSTEGRNDTEVKQNKYVSSTGGFILSRTDASSLDEIQLDLVVFVDGYFTTGQTIIIPAAADVPEDGAGFVVVTVTPNVVDDSGESTTAVTGSTETVKVNDDGTVAEEIVISTPVPQEGDKNEEAVAGGTVDLAIPAGTTLKDREGNVVTGPIEANVVYFSNEPVGTADLDTDSALLSFPGGLAPSQILDEDGNPDDELSEITFISAGFTAIEMRTEDGTLVRDFEPPIDLTFQVSAETLNPDTGNKVQSGETIPVWSYDELEGLWKAEGDAEVGAFNEDSNTFTVTKQISHLSYYNLDYRAARCDVEFTVRDSVTENYRPRVLFVRDGGGWTGQAVVSFGTHTYRNVPENGEGTVAITKYRTTRAASLIKSAVDKDGNAINVNTDGTLTANFCSLDGATFTVESEVVDNADYSLSLQSVCEGNGETTPQPGYVRYYKAVGDQNFSLGAFSIGKGSTSTLSLEPGTYEFHGELRGNNLKGETETFNRVELTSGQNIVDTLDFMVPASECIVTGGTGGNGGGGGTGS